MTRIFPIFFFVFLLKNSQKWRAAEIPARIILIAGNSSLIELWLIELIEMFEISLAKNAKIASVELEFEKKLNPSVNSLEFDYS